MLLGEEGVNLVSGPIVDASGGFRLMIARFGTLRFASSSTISLLLHRFTLATTTKIIVATSQKSIASPYSTQGALPPSSLSSSILVASLTFPSSRSCSPTLFIYTSIDQTPPMPPYQSPLFNLHKLYQFPLTSSRNLRTTSLDLSASCDGIHSCRTRSLGEWRD